MSIKNIFVTFVILILVVVIFTLTAVGVSKKKDGFDFYSILLPKDDYYLPNISSDVDVTLDHNEILNAIKQKNHTIDKSIESIVSRLATYETTNWWHGEIGSPKLIAYALSETGLARNENLEKIFSTIISKYSDPFHRHATGAVETWTNLYHKVSYHYIYYKYVDKYNLSKTLTYNDEMKNKIYKFLNEPVGYSKLPLNSTKMTDGYYVDEIYGENGLLYHGKIPYGNGYLTALVEPVYYIIKNDPTNKHLLNLLQNIYKRIHISMFDDFVQIRGGGRGISRLIFKSNWLNAIGCINEVSPNLSIGNEFYKQINLTPKVYRNNLTSFSKYKISDNSSQKFTYHSLSEGFSLVRNGRNSLEIASGSSLYNMETGTVHDDLVYNVNCTKGYINYGCDYTTMFRNYNKADDSSFYLVGQGFNGSDFIYPISAVIAPIDSEESLFFTCHSYDKSRIVGYYDSITGIHSYTIVNNLNNVTTYCPFLWVSRGSITVQKLTDYSYLIVTSEKTFNVESSVKLKASIVNMITDAMFAKITTVDKLPLNTPITFKISRLSSYYIKERIPSLTPFTASDYNITISPNNDVKTDFYSAKYESEEIIVSTSVPGTWSNSPQSITYNSVIYPILKKPLLYMAKIK